MLVDTPDIEVTSNITGRVVPMQMDPLSTKFLMGYMIKLYANPTRAVVREYSTNAYDSHVEAGQTRPIEVSLPDQFNPVFKVQDFGVGMNAQDIIDVYSKYGASTKRDTNEQQGQLGLGCKSALAYADMFTVVGVKGGVKTTIVVARDEEGSCNMTIVSEDETDEPNGVTVSVPVERYNRFAEEARDFFAYWKPGTVLVNGQRPAPVNGMWLSDRLLVSDEPSQDQIVMGNVAYPTDFGTRLRYGHCLVAFVDIGTITFPPNREAPEDSLKTRQAITSIRNEFDESMMTAIQRDIDKAASPYEALRVAYAWHGATSAFNITKLTYKDDSLPTEIGDYSDGIRYRLTERASDKLSKSAVVRDIHTKYAHRALFVEGYALESFTPAHKKKLNLYAERNMLTDVQWYVLTDERVESKWIGPRAKWEDIAAIKLPTNRAPRATAQVTGPPRLKGSYDIKVGETKQYGVPASSIITKNGVIYVVEKWYGHQATMVNNLLTKHYRDATLVFITQNRVKKFERDFPMAVEAGKALKNKYNEIAKGVTPRQRLQAKVNNDYGARSQLQSLKPEKIDDPELRDGIRLAQGVQSQRVAQLHEFRNLRFHERLKLKDPLKLEKVKWTNPLHKYPLYNQAQLRNHPKDMYIYLNAAYAARRKESK